MRKGRLARKTTRALERTERAMENVREIGGGGDHGKRTKLRMTRKWPIEYRKDESDDLHVPVGRPRLESG